MKPLLSELFYRVPGCIHPFGQIAIRWPQLPVLKGPPVKLIHGLARTKTTPTSAPTAAQLTLFHASGCAAPMATHSIPSPAKMWNDGGVVITECLGGAR